MGLKAKGVGSVPFALGAADDSTLLVPPSSPKCEEPAGGASVMSVNALAMSCFRFTRAFLTKSGLMSRDKELVRETS